MKRRYFLIAFGLAVPLCLGLWAKKAASWRPVEIARFPLNTGSEERQTVVSGHEAVQTFYDPAKGETTTGVLWNDATGKEQLFSFRGRHLVGMQNGYFWHSRVSFEGNTPFSIDLKLPDGREKFFIYRNLTYDQPDNKTLRVLPGQNRVVVLDSYGLVEWTLRDAKFKHAIGMASNGARALSRDGRTFFVAGTTLVEIGDATTGKGIKRIPHHVLAWDEQFAFSPYGHYILFEESLLRNYVVVDAVTGHKLWKFRIPNGSFPLYCISDDEQTVFIAQAKEWQVRDLKTGVLRRRLPLVPGVTVAACSPDASTLYSVANGVLYRQRAQ